MPDPEARPIGEDVSHLMGGLVESPPGAPTAPTAVASKSAGAELAPVTLHDLKQDPREAMARIGRILKKDVTDPKLWMGLGAMYFGAKAFNVAAPMIARAVPRVSPGGLAAAAKELTRDIPVVRQVQPAMRAYRAYQQAAGADVAGASPIAAVPSTAPIAPPSAEPLTARPNTINAAMEEAIAKQRASQITSAAVPRVASVAAAPSPAAMPEGLQERASQMGQQTLATLRAGGYDVPEGGLRTSADIDRMLTRTEQPLASTSLSLNQAERALRTATPAAKLKLTAPETKQALRLVRQGHPPEQVLEAIRTLRALRASPSFAGLPTETEVAAAVSEKNVGTRDVAARRAREAADAAAVGNPFR